MLGNQPAGGWFQLPIIIDDCASVHFGRRDPRLVAR
jgi:hypothetical protein